MTAARAIERDPAAPETAAPDPGFGVYIHWPFCRAKCPYCDFNSHVRETVEQARWRRALLAELDHYTDLSGPRRVTSIFFGGGTPSLMPAETVAALIERVGARFDLARDAEVTLEANPTSVEAERFAAFRAAGINRVSLGVQALDDAALAFLGRQHSAAESLAAITLARRHFARVSFDLIYARPEQSEAAWRAELAAALAEGPTHLSLYQLTIEEGTAFHGAARRGELAVPDEARAAALYETTQALLSEAGLAAYEISNHARPGEESRHNLTYWRYGDYLGIGPGAHGRLTLEGRKLATRQHRAPEAWLAAVEAEGHAARARVEIGREERLAELLMMGLRLTEGVSRSAFERELAESPERLLDSRRSRSLIESGDLVLDDLGLRATAAGRLRLNAVLGHLLA